MMELMFCLNIGIKVISTKVNQVTYQGMHPEQDANKEEYDDLKNWNAYLLLVTHVILEGEVESSA